MPYSSFIVGLELAGGVSLHGSMSSWPAEHDMDGRASKTESPGILWLKSCGPSLCLTAFRGGLLQMPHALVAGTSYPGPDDSTDSGQAGSSDEESEEYHDASGTRHKDR